MRAQQVAILSCLLLACAGDDLDDSRETSSHDELREDSLDGDQVSAALLDDGDAVADADEDEDGPLAEAEDEALESDGGDEEGEEEGEEKSEEKSAALAAAEGNFAYHRCVHDNDARRPKLRRDRQRETQRLITHVSKRMRSSPGFRNLLMLVALREASYQQGLVHQLNADLESSRAAWRRMSGRYDGNTFADDPEVWQTYGLFGMNSNFFTMLWDKQADPRVLCDPIVDMVVYRRAAARALRKLNGSIRCKDADGETYTFNGKPTWRSIHRAVNGGKLCPSKHEDQASIMRKYFDARAHKAGLDPDEPVTLKMLGEEPTAGKDGADWETQEQLVEGLWAEFEALEAELEQES